MQKEDWNKNLLRSNTRNQRQQIQTRRDIENRGVRDKIYCKNAIEDGGHLSLLPKTTRLSSTRLPSRSLGEGWSRRGVREGGSTLNPQLSILNFCFTHLSFHLGPRPSGIFFFAAVSISNVKSEDQTPIFSQLNTGMFCRMKRPKPNRVEASGSRDTATSVMQIGLLTSVGRVFAQFFQKLQQCQPFVF